MSEEAEQVIQLKNTRKSLRRQITLLSDKIVGYVGDKDVTSAVATGKVMKIVYNKLEICTGSVNELVVASEEETDKELLYLEKYCLAETQVDTLVVETQQETKAKSPIPVVQNTVKLEKLSLPTFDGTPLKFVGFWESFLSRVDRNQSLSDIDKLEYFKTKLRGSAASAIEGLEFSSKGYKEAVDIIKRRFGRKVPLINSHLSALFALPYLESMSEVTALRKLCDEMNVHIRSLRSLDVNISNNSEVLGPILLSRLPMALRVKWQERSRALSEKSLDTSDSGSINAEDYSCIQVVDLLEFFTQQVEDREVGLETKAAKVSNPSVRVVKREREQSTVSTFIAAGVNSNVKSCLICHKVGHTLPRECPVFGNASKSERSRLVQNASLCFNCLYPSHPISRCTSRGRCRQCFGKHHTMLCNQMGKSHTETRDKPQSVSYTVPSFSMVAQGAHSFSSAVLLQTIRVMAYGPKGHRPIRVLLDGCSNQSYLRREVAKDLGLAVIGKEILTVNSFNLSQTEKMFDICNVVLRPESQLIKNVSLQLSVHVCDSLCHPICNPEVNVAEYPHLKSLYFTEDYSQGQPRDIDMLLGGDYLYDVVTNQSIRGPRGSPVGVETIFGWTLHGPHKSIVTSLKKHSQESSVLLCQSVSQVESPPEVEKLWSLESIGVKTIEDEDEHWIAPCLEKGRFQVKLPWKSSERPRGSFVQLLHRQARMVLRLSASQKVV